MTVCSMTSFGRGEMSGAHGSYRCEIKTLNARFLDINVRMPRSLMAIETQIHAKVKEALGRGKVDITVDWRPNVDQAGLPQVSATAVMHYGNLFNEAQSALDGTGVTMAPLKFGELLRQEGVLVSGGGIDEGQLAAHADALFGVLSLALDQVQDGRQREGLKLKDALSKVVDEIAEDVGEISNRIGGVQEDLAAQLRQRLDALWEMLGTELKGAGKLPEDRLITELCLLQDKHDIAEELTRLDAHIGSFRNLLEADGRWGRKLDFLCQELHREVNTIGSKVSQLEVSNHVISIKHAIERLRQQVQNIE